MTDKQIDAALDDLQNRIRPTDLDGIAAFDTIRQALRALAEQSERERVPHQCTPIARAYMSEGRDWWVGKLTEPVESYPQESFCLHMKTPIKDVVFLCNAADFEQLTILCRAVTGPLNPVWVDRMVSNVTKRAAAPAPSLSLHGGENDEGHD